MDRACIIGAGSSGIASCQVLHARGIPFDCFETGSEVGGNWRYNNDNGMSSAYRSLHAKSSRRCMQYAAFPMPKPEEIAVYRVVPKVISVLDYSKGFGHSDLVTV